MRTDIRREGKFEISTTIVVPQLTSKGLPESTGRYLPGRGWEELLPGSCLLQILTRELALLMPLTSDQWEEQGPRKSCGGSHGSVQKSENLSSNIPDLLLVSEREPQEL